MTNPTGSASSLPRPRQVTFSAWMIMVGSVMVVMFAYDQVANMHTVAWRDSVEEMLAGGSFGLSIDDVRSMMHAAALVAGGCAAAAAILGWHVLQPSKSARLALTVLAVPLFVAGIATGGLLPTLVVVSIVMLWVPPSNYWFDGRKAPEPEPRERTGSSLVRRSSRRSAGSESVPVRTQSHGNVMSGQPVAGASSAVPQSPPYAPPAGFEAVSAPLQAATQTWPAPDPALAQPLSGHPTRGRRPVGLVVATAIGVTMSVLVGTWQLVGATVDASWSVPVGWTVVVLLWCVAFAAVSVGAWSGRRVWWALAMVMAAVNVFAAMLLGIAWLYVGDPSTALVYAALGLGSIAMMATMQSAGVVRWLLSSRGPGQRTR